MKMEEFYNKIKSCPPVHLHVQPDGCEGLLGPEAVHQGLAVGLPDLQLGLAVVPAQSRVLLSRSADNYNPLLDSWCSCSWLLGGRGSCCSWVLGSLPLRPPGRLVSLNLGQHLRLRSLLLLQR